VSEATLISQHQTVHVSTVVYRNIRGMAAKMESTSSSVQI